MTHSKSPNYKALFEQDVRILTVVELPYTPFKVAYIPQHFYSDMNDLFILKETQLDAVQPLIPVLPYNGLLLVLGQIQGLYARYNQLFAEEVPEDVFSQVMKRHIEADIIMALQERVVATHVKGEEFAIEVPGHLAPTVTVNLIGVKGQVRVELVPIVEEPQGTVIGRV